MDDSGSATGNTEDDRTGETIEVRRVAALVLTELAGAAKAATWTVAALMAAVWVYSGVDSGGYVTGPFDFPGRYLFALLPVLFVWLTLKGSSERLAQEGRGVPTPSEAENS
jgi:hypothetical protein